MNSVYSLAWNRRHNCWGSSCTWGMVSCRRSNPTDIQRDTHCSSCNTLTYISCSYCSHTQHSSTTWKSKCHNGNWKLVNPSNFEYFMDMSGSTTLNTSRIHPCTLSSCKDWCRLDSPTGTTNKLDCNNPRSRLSLDMSPCSIVNGTGSISLHK